VETEESAGVPKKVNWMGFTDAVKASEKEPRKIFIDVYTDWCGWCKVMDNKTFTDTAIIRILNNKYYPVKLNAETKESITFKNYKFDYKAEYKANELAVALLNGQLSYPSLVLLTEDNNVLERIPGYQKPEMLKPMLTFLGDDVYKIKQWDVYLKEYNDSINAK
jgi:thioredoxin-related protein